MAHPFASTTPIVNACRPATVGVPSSTPLDVASVSPTGSKPVGRPGKHMDPRHRSSRTLAGRPADAPDARSGGDSVIALQLASVKLMFETKAPVVTAIGVPAVTLQPALVHGCSLKTSAPCEALASARAR